MELSWLEDFLALAEHRNFSRAAELRHVTQPAFSRRIRSLENWIGAPLFVRSPQGVSLNAAGEFLRLHAEEITRNIHQIRREIREIAGREIATLSFVATHALSFTFFPGLIRKQTSLETLGALNLISDSMEACEHMMLRGEAHFLLCHHYRDALTRFEPGQFSSLVVGDDILIPLSAPDGNGEPLWSLPGTLQTPVRYLSYSPQSGLGRILTANWTTRQSPLNLEKVFTSHLAATLLTMAREGEGIAWLPKTLADDDMAAGRLVAAGDKSFCVPVEIRLFRSARRQTRFIESFWRLLAQAYPRGE